MPACEPLLAWYDAVRRDLPWRHTRDPYRIWLSEIMLQQTRTETVKSYYNRFLVLFPTVADLAHAPSGAGAQGLGGPGLLQPGAQPAKGGAGHYERAWRRFSHKLRGAAVPSGRGALYSGSDRQHRLRAGVYRRWTANVYRVASRFYGIREDVGRPVVQRRIRDLVTGRYSRGPSRRLQSGFDGAGRHAVPPGRTRL